MRRSRTTAALAALCLIVPATPAMAAPAPMEEPSSAVFAVETGELAAGGQGKVKFSVGPDDYTAAGNGRVLIGFMLEPAPGSGLDPGRITVTSTSGSSPVTEFHGLDTPGATSSFAIVALTSGSSYEVSFSAEKGTAGAYQLSSYLAGDANGDFQVNQDDITLIESLSVTKHGEPGYVGWADINRNGVINRGDRMAAARNFGAATRLRLEVANPLDEALPDGALALEGLSAQAFNPVAAPLTFSLTGAAFYEDAGETSVVVNGRPVPAGRISVAPQQVSAGAALESGRNDIQFSSVDEIGRPLYHHATVWTGTNTLRVDVVDEAGALVTDEVTVRVSLTDDQEVFSEQGTTSGRATFANVPARTVLVKATASGNRLGIVGLHSGQGSVRVRLLGFGAPSAVDNNDFSQGTAGWNTGGAPVWIGPHYEGVPGLAALTGPGTQSAQRAEPPPMTPATASSTAASATAAAASIVDNDLTLGTAGEGEQSISRTFTTDEDVTAVRVRYRFITSEVPGGWFGSQYNDYFRVSLRSQKGGGSAAEANSMNGLGLGAFDYGSGATGWRDLLLPVDKAGDTIQVDLGVANVGDALYHSQVVVDFVEEVRDQVKPSLAWNNTAGGLNLTYEVEKEALKQAATIEVFFANGTGYDSRLGAAVFSHSVPAGTAAGTHGPVHIPGDRLAGDPAGTTHLIAVASPSRVAALADVTVNFGANANQASVWDRTIDAVKDSLRAAGQASATITSTARTPADQARAMFQNLTKSGKTIQTNVNEQYALYGAGGDQVIDTFVAETKGLTRDQILADATNIKSKMEDKINDVGPQKVSRHCADPKVVNVADISAGAFNSSNDKLFMSAIKGRVTRLIDERSNNNCFHIELE